MEIVTGTILGLSTLLFIGPVFFYLIESSVSYGTRAGISAAIGIIIGDILYVILSLKGLRPVLESPSNQKWIAIIGGSLVVIIGLRYIFKPKSKPSAHLHLNKKGLLSISIKAFLLNFINPFVLAVWIGFITYNQAKFDTQYAVTVSLTTTLLVIFLTDIVKVLLATKIKKAIIPKYFTIIQKVIGLLLLIFALKLFYIAI